MSPTALSVEQILGQARFDDYITKREELERIVERCGAVLHAQAEEMHDQRLQTHETLEFIRSLWAKYDCKEIADIYGDFVKIEEALYGLEREEERGERYRDHFVHMFNCFLFGLRLISLIISFCGEAAAKSMFKVEKENLKEAGLPWGTDYPYKQRLFYLWTLISTFHDIAIPFQHLTKIGKGVNKFIQEFGWVFTDPSISMRHFDASQLYAYFTLLASIYGGRLELEDGGRRYKRAKEPQAYLVKLLGREFDQRNHGVLSGFFMWKTIEEIFLVGRSAKYQFTEPEFNVYTKFVLEQDVARAALAISMHGLKEDERTNVHPKIFPIRFSDFPLAFILILSDETQEYLRWEGTSIRRGIKFSDHPLLDVTSKEGRVSLKASFSFHPEQEDYIVAEVRKIVARRTPGREVANIQAAISEMGDSLGRTLMRKLVFDNDFELEIAIYQEWKQNLYSSRLPVPN